MLRFLQKSKAKKGFTVIELIVVITIIAVLTAVILPTMSSEKSRINEARSAAADFYAAVQTVMSKFSLYDGSLSPEYSKKADLGIVRHYAKMGGNYPYDKDAGITDHEFPAETSLYIMVYAKNGNIDTVGAVSKAKSSTKPEAESGFFRLLQRYTADRLKIQSSDTSTSKEFHRLFAAEINDRVRFSDDGYYYARVDFIPPTNPDKTIKTDEIKTATVKVAYAVYSKKQLTEMKTTDNASTFANANLYFGSDFKLNSGTICGTCAPMQSSGKYVGLAGTKLD